MDKQIIDLTSKTSVVGKDFETTPAARMQGGNAPDIATSNIRMYIGNKPIPTDIRKLYKKHNKPVPPEVEIFKSYNAYFLPHTIGVMQEGGWESIKQIGYQMKFPSDAEIVVLNVFPESKYVTNVGGNLSFEADLSLNGEAHLPKTVTAWAESTEVLSAGGRLKVATDNSLVGRFKFSVVTPEIMSIGKGNTYSEWVFNRGENPLFGNDIEMFQMILVDKYYEEPIKFQARIYCVIAAWGLIPSRRESDWIPIECMPHR